MYAIGSHRNVTPAYMISATLWPTSSAEAANALIIDLLLMLFRKRLKGEIIKK
jgi:hypothetical protein